jgi:hypothetical protein
MGQLNMLVLSLMVYSLWLLKKKKEFASGIVLGISLIIKLFPILLPVYFLLSLKGKILLGVLTSFLITALLVVVFVPFQTYSQFIFNVLPSFVTSWKLDYYNQSLAGFVGRSFGTGELGNALKTAFSLSIVFMTFFIVLKNKQMDFVTFSLKLGTLITASLLINTFSWQHHFVWLIIPFYITFFYLIKHKSDKKYLILLFISYFLVSMNFKDSNFLPVLFQSHVFYGTLILLFIDFKLLFDNKKLE